MPDPQSPHLGNSREPSDHEEYETTKQEGTMIHNHLDALKPNRDPDFIIGNPDNPYMLRWWLVPRNDTFNIYYHRVLKDDDDRALHDHPWPSFSIMVRGSVREITPDGTREIHQGECIYRDENYSHRLELIDGPCETLFITGPKIREWGFHCPQGFVPWHEFVDQSNHGNIGRGCGEHETRPDGKPLDEVCADCTPCHVDEIGFALYGKGVAT